MQADSRQRQNGSFAERIVMTAKELEGAAHTFPRSRLRSELWVLVTGLLTQYVRRYGSSRLDLDTQRDIISEKALEVMLRIDQGKWAPACSGPAKVTRFLSSVARFGVIDCIRATTREPLANESHQAAVSTGSGPPIGERGGPDRHDAILTPARSVEAGVDVREFVDALCGCLAGVTRRARWIWALRVNAHQEPHFSERRADVVPRMHNLS